MHTYGCMLVMLVPTNAVDGVTPLEVESGSKDSVDPEKALSRSAEMPDTKSEIRIFIFVSAATTLLETKADPCMRRRHAKE